MMQALLTLLVLFLAGVLADVSGCGGFVELARCVEAKKKRKRGFVFFLFFLFLFELNLVIKYTLLLNCV